MSTFDELSQQLSNQLSTGSGTSFHSPLVGVSASMEAGNPAPITFSSDLALIKHPGSLCLGKIGAVGKFCLRRKDQCSYEIHKSVKVEFEYQRFFVVLGGSKEVAYCQPVLDAAALNADLEEDLLLARQDADWAKTFTVISDNNIVSNQEEKRLKKLTATARKAAIYRTPAKLATLSNFDVKISVLKESLDNLDTICLCQGNMVICSVWR